MPDDMVRTEVSGHVLVVTMQREAKRNAVDRAMADALDDAFNRLEDDDDLWVGVLSGSDRFFSAGSDLTAGGDYVTERGGEYGLVRRHRAKPLIAAVEGPALGGGFELVLACDLVVAGRTARFGLPEVCIGVVAACGALFRAPRQLPLNVARQLVPTGWDWSTCWPSPARRRRQLSAWPSGSAAMVRSPSGRAWPPSSRSCPPTTRRGGRPRQRPSSAPVPRPTPARGSGRSSRSGPRCGRDADRREPGSPPAFGSEVMRGEMV